MELDRASDVKLYQQVFEQIREAIGQGLLSPGMKLPPIRSLAQDLGCSKNTVETAYQLLVQEGYALGRMGSGYIVLDSGLVHASPGPLPNALDVPDENASSPAVIYDFNYGNLEPGTFPASAWRMLTNEVLSGTARFMADVYTDPLGEMDLRRQIALQLSATRGIACSPEQIVIQGGTEQSVQNLLALFDHRNDTILMEEPGYNGIRDAFIRSGFKVRTVPVEQGTAAYLEGVYESFAKLAFVTPSSQFPTCKAMDLDTRRRVMAWAEQGDAYILEDDYCREFRYLERPAPPLASMDRSGHVIYMGTFSKALSPALRMNYLVLPETLLEGWTETFAHTYPAVPWLSQAVLAKFMESGQWDRHLRRLQSSNRRKYEALTGAIRRKMGQRVAVRENGTGLHLLVDVLGGRGQEELIELALANGVRVYPTSEYCMNEQPSMRSCLLIGFSSIREEDIEPGIEALARAWF